MTTPSADPNGAPLDKTNFVASTHGADSPQEYDDQSNKLEKGALYESSTSDSRLVLSGAEEKKLLRRIDWRLLPLLAAMYVIKTIDAQNVSRSIPHI